MKTRNNPYSASFSADEIENMPQTTTVFNQEALDFHKHTWVQEGYELIDTCAHCPRYGIPIPFGKMLVKGENGYELIDELRPELDTKRASKALQAKEAKKAEDEAKKTK